MKRDGLHQHHSSTVKQDGSRSESGYCLSFLTSAQQVPEGAQEPVWSHGGADDCTSCKIYIYYIQF